MAKNNTLPKFKVTVRSDGLIKIRPLQREIEVPQNLKASQLIWSR